MNGKQLRKSKTNKKICGVCGGLGEWLGIDPTIIRLAWIVASLTLGFGILAYIIAALIMPYAKEDEVEAWKED